MLCICILRRLTEALFTGGQQTLYTQRLCHGKDKQARLDVDAQSSVSCGWERQSTESLAVLALTFLLPQAVQAKGEQKSLKNQGKTK